MTRRDLVPLFATAWLLCLLAFDAGDNPAQSQPQPPLQVETAAEAIAALRQIGGVFTFSQDGLRRPLELTFVGGELIDADLVHLKWLPSLEVLDFNASNRITDAALSHVAQLPELRSLNIGGTPVTDAGLRSVRGLKKLETVQAWLTELGDVGLLHLRQLPRLRVLNLWDAQVTDKGLATLAEMKSLERLFIGSSLENRGLVLGEPAQEAAVSAAAVHRLRESLPRAKIYYWDAAEQQEGTAPAGRAPAVARIRQRTQSVAGQLPPNLATRHDGVDWPGMLGPTGDSKSPETGISLDWPANGPPIVWQRPVSDSHGVCAISRGRLFLFDRVGDRVRLVCLNAETGAEIWKFTAPTDYVDQVGYGDGPRCSPVVDGDRVYAYGADGMLYCLSATDGSRVWQVDTAKRFGVAQYFFGVGSTPVIEGDLLIVVVGGSPIAADARQVNLSQLTGNNSGVVAFDKHTGEVVYSVGDTLASYASPKLATIAGRRWCLVFARGMLIGLEPHSGELDFEFPWKAKFPAAVSAATPVVVGDEVFISEAYGPGCCKLKVRPGGCEVVWQDDPRRREKVMQTHWNTPVYHDGHLYACSGRHANDGELRCVNWETGKVVWRHPTQTRSSLLYVDGHFLALGEYGRLDLFEATSEAYRRTASVVLREDPVDPQSPPLLKYPAWSAPVLSHGLLYVRGKDRLVCLRLIDSPTR